MSIFCVATRPARYWKKNILRYFFSNDIYCDIVGPVLYMEKYKGGWLQPTSEYNPGRGYIIDYKKEEEVIGAASIYVKYNK